MGDADVVVTPLGLELAGALAGVSMAGGGVGVEDGGGVEGAGGAVLTGAGGTVGEGGGVGEHAASSATLAKGAISIKRRRVAGDTMMMSLADKSGGSCPAKTL
jgi:hypothetical protein